LLSFFSVLLPSAQEGLAIFKMAMNNGLVLVVF